MFVSSPQFVLITLLFFVFDFFFQVKKHLLCLSFTKDQKFLKILLHKNKNNTFSCFFHLLRIIINNQ